MYIDNHCHIFSEYYDDIEKTINESFEKNVNILILSGCSKKDIIEGLDLIKKI